MKNRRGFTLVELLVVVSVITLLLAILLPSLARAKKQAKTALCATNVRSMAQTTRMYVQEWGVMFTGGGHNGPMGVWDYQLFGAGFTKAAYYAKNGRHDSIDKVRWCPETLTAAKTVVGTATTQWNCEQTGLNSTGSYGFNGWLYAPSDAKAASLAGSGWVMSSVIGAAPTGDEERIPLFVDADWHDLWPLATDTAPANSINPGPTTSGGAANSIRRACLNRHSMAVNASFVDGHVETVKLSNLWTLKWSANWTRNTSQRVN